MDRNIGLIISGCKRNFGVICDNNVVNLNEPSIHKALIDIRQHVVVHKSYVDFFSVEYLNNYVAITGYRSSKDFGRDGYMAVTILTRYSDKIQHVRKLLKDLLDCYFRNYMNPLTWEPVTNKSEDIRLFESIMDHYDVVPNEEQDIIPGKPGYLVYENETMLDDYLDNPLRPELTLSQKVYLISRTILNTSGEQQLDLYVPPINGQKADSFHHQPKEELETNNRHDADENSDEGVDDEDIDLPPIVEKETVHENLPKGSPDSSSSKRKKYLIAAAISVLLLGSIGLLLQSGKQTSEEPVQIGLDDVNVGQVQEQSDEEAEAVEENIENDSILQAQILAEAEAAAMKEQKKAEEAKAIAKARAEEEQKKQEAAEKERQLKPLREQLNRIDVSFGVAQQVKEKASQLGDTQLAARAQDYMTFFNAKSVEDVHRCMKSFSPMQKSICNQTYARSTKDFEFFKKNCGMDFAKAKARMKNQE